jgi:hypothetical protein
MKTFKIFLLFKILIAFVKCEVFSSTDGLVDLLKNGRGLVQGLSDLIEDLEYDVESLKM